MSEYTVGIDSIALHIPKPYLDLQGEWLKARAPIFTSNDENKLVSKLNKSIGITKMAVPDAHEDPATMGAMAIKNLLDANQIDLKEVGHIAVATESGVDHSKSISSSIIGMLGLHYQDQSNHIGAIEYKFACVSSTYALEAGLSLLESPRYNYPYLIVVCTDVAKYRLEENAEYTQGAGAVALLLSKNPRLLSIDNKPMGTFTLDEYDFYRPLWSDYPMVDGKHSLSVYNKSLIEAYKRFVANDKKESNAANHFDHFLFHVPFPNMSRYAAAELLYSEQLQAINDPLERKNHLKELLNSESFKSFFDNKIEPALGLSKEIGNIYTGSLYLALVSLIENAKNNDIELKNNKAVFLAYGSGSSSKVFSGEFKKEWKKVALQNNWQQKLADVENGGIRKSLTLEQYEKLHAQAGNITVKKELENLTSIFNPNQEFVFQGTSKDSLPGKRIYRYIYKTSC
ncbi:MAG: hydroxymethylglutaryl-CoA synthase family protein [Bacteriovoracia bacterium]